MGCISPCLGLRRHRWWSWQDSLRCLWNTGRWEDIFVRLLRNRFYTCTEKLCPPNRCTLHPGDICLESIHLSDTDTMSLRTQPNHLSLMYRQYLLPHLATLLITLGWLHLFLHDEYDLLSVTFTTVSNLLESRQTFTHSIVSHSLTVGI